MLKIVQILAYITCGVTIFGVHFLFANSETEESKNQYVINLQNPYARGISQAHYKQIGKILSALKKLQGEKTEEQFVDFLIKFDAVLNGVLKKYQNKYRLEQIIYFLKYELYSFDGIGEGIIRMDGICQPNNRFTWSSSRVVYKDSFQRENKCLLGEYLGPYSSLGVNREGFDLYEYQCQGMNGGEPTTCQKAVADGLRFFLDKNDHIINANAFCVAQGLSGFTLGMKFPHTQEYKWILCYKGRDRK